MMTLVVVCLASFSFASPLQLPFASPLQLPVCNSLCPTRCVQRVRHRPLRAIAFEFPEEEDDDDEEYAVIEAAAQKLTELPATNLTVAELQSQLKQLGQRHTGTKAQLIERVQLMQRKQALGLPIHDMAVDKMEDLRWYMLQTANGFERAVERTLLMAIKAQGLEDQIDRVFVPILEGETSIRDSSVMPSYIFVRMRMDAKLHFFVSNLQYVTSFVGFDRGGRTASGQMEGSRGL